MDSEAAIVYSGGGGDIGQDIALRQSFVFPTMNIMMHTLFMGFLVGSSEILLVEDLAQELLSKSSLLCKNSVMLFSSNFLPPSE